MKTTVDEFLKLPYTKEIIENSDGTFFIRIKELPGCMSEGNSLAEAYEMIQDAMADWMNIALNERRDIPLPETQIKKEYSGKFVIRTSRELHRKLAKNAEKNGVSLNAYVNGLLSENNSQIETLERCLTTLTYHFWRADLDKYKGSIPSEKYIGIGERILPKIKSQNMVR